MYAIDCLQRLARVKGIELDEPRFEGYARLLVDLAEKQFAYACTQAANRLVYFPQPAEIRQFAAEYLRTPEAIEARERRNRELDEKIAEPYKRRKLEGREPAALKSILEYPETTVAALQTSPDFQSAVRRLRMDRAPLTRAHIPADVQSRKGPEWEERIRQQAQELRQKAEETAQ